MRMRQLVLSCVLLSLPTGAAFGRQDSGEGAYRRWCESLAANGWMNVPHWFSADSGPLEHRQAVRNLLAFGPNLLPVLVQELRQETDQLRLYRLIFLLSHVSGINLYADSGHENHWDAVYEFKTDFLTNWDAGAYQQARTRLMREWHGGPGRGGQAGTVDPNALTPLLRYGVFAVPFIVERLARENSNEWFAAYLVNTRQLELYRVFIERPASLCPTRPEKVAHIRRWIRDNRRQVSRLQSLSKEFEALAAR